jgi:hypothetical protein
MRKTIVPAGELLPSFSARSSIICQFAAIVNEFALVGDEVAGKTQEGPFR